MLLPISLGALLAAMPALANNPDAITVEDIREHIAVLASDDYEGREPGTPGGEKAETYVADQFRKAGLKAAGVDGGWKQPIVFTKRTAGVALASFTDGKNKINIDPFKMVIRGMGAVQSLEDVPMVMIGKGEGALPDLMGKAAVMSYGDAATYAARLEALQKAGASAVVVIVANDFPLEQSQKQLSHPDTQMGEAKRPGVTIIIRAKDTRRLLGTAPAKAKPGPLQGRLYAYTQGKLENYTSSNIIGKIPGKDPAAGAVIVMAHWDHIGICRPEGEADRICNGAVDNASGTAALIEVAERLAKGPQIDRDVYFVATTAEEKGLLGARYFTENPLIPLDNIQAVINLDTIAVAAKGMPVAAINRKGTKLGPIVDEAARLQGRKIDEDTEADGFIQRQDGWPFTQKNVPAIMAGGSFSDMSILEGFLTSDYHGPKDELTDKSDLSGAAEDAELHVTLVRLAADKSKYSR